MNLVKRKGGNINEVFAYEDIETRPWAATRWRRDSRINNWFDGLKRSRTRVEHNIMAVVRRHM